MNPVDASNQNTSLGDEQLDDSIDDTFVSVGATTVLTVSFGSTRRPARESACTTQGMVEMPGTLVSAACRVADLWIWRLLTAN